MSERKNCLFVRLHGKPGKEKELSVFLKALLPLAFAEKGIVDWFAVQFDPLTFGIFDTFRGNAERDEHMNGKMAAALMAYAPELLSEAPRMEKMELLASK